MNIIKSSYPEVAEYLQTKCKPEKTFLYSILEQGYTTHGHNTSNIVEIMNNVIGDARFRDPYFLNDFILQWHGGKLAERQSIGEQITAANKLVTLYAYKMMGKREVFAREKQLKVKSQGDQIYLVTDDDDDERYHVNLKKKTCSCPFVRTHRLPCEHVICVLDQHGLRGSLEGWNTFRKDWVAPYFWAENYVDAYMHEFVITPYWDKGDKLKVTKGERVITKPLMKNNQRRNVTKRKSKGEGGRRSRAKFDRKGYEQYKRQQAGRPGPFNPFVKISDPTIFDKKPCGRKPLTWRERSEGSKRARHRLLEAGKNRGGKKRVKNSSRVVSRSRSNVQSQFKSGSGSQTVPMIPTTSSSELPQHSIPIIPTPSPTLGSFEIPLPCIPRITTTSPTLGSFEIPLPCIPRITTPFGYPNFDMGAYLNILNLQQSGTGYPMLLPKDPTKISD